MFTAAHPFPSSPQGVVQNDPAWGPQARYRRRQGPTGLWTDLLNHACEREKGGGFVTPLQNRSVKTGGTSPDLPP